MHDDEHSKRCTVHQHDSVVIQPADLPAVFLERAATVRRWTNFFGRIQRARKVMRGAERRWSRAVASLYAATVAQVLQVCLSLQPDH